SREVIADSIETMMHAERFDGMVTFAGCDKSLPGMLMAAGRLNLTSVFLYGGAILPGHWKDQALDVVSVFEAIGACAAGTITEDELELDDFNRIAAKVPHIADTKPHGKYHMADIDRIGGVQVVLRELLDAGLLHGDCLTVTGKTLAENIAALDPPAPDGDVVHA